MTASLLLLLFLFAYFNVPLRFSLTLSLSLSVFDAVSITGGCCGTAPFRSSVVTRRLGWNVFHCCWSAPRNWITWYTDVQHVHTHVSRYNYVFFFIFYHFIIIFYAFLSLINFIFFLIVWFDNFFLLWS